MDTGFRGRTGIYELLVLDEELRAEILLQGGTGELRKLARDRGMVALLEDGVRHIRIGVTTPSR